MKKSSQNMHPWKTTFRTVFQMVIGFIILLPQLIETTGVDEATPWVAASLAVSGAVTRIMALPGVETWLRKWVPWLAADEEDFFYHDVSE